MMRIMEKVRFLTTVAIILGLASINCLGDMEKVEFKKVNVASIECEQFRSIRNETNKDIKFILRCKLVFYPASEKGNVITKEGVILIPSKGTLTDANVYMSSTFPCSYVFPARPLHWTFEILLEHTLSDNLPWQDSILKADQYGMSYDSRFVSPYCKGYPSQSVFSYSFNSVTQDMLDNSTKSKSTL